MRAGQVVLSILALAAVSGCGSSGTIVMQDATMIVDGVDLTLAEDTGDAEVALDVLDSAQWDFGRPQDLLMDQSVELTPECEAGSGCFLDSCIDNSECLSGWCVEHQGEGVCTQTCDSECPVGWSCKQVAGTEPDVVFVCVSDFSNLCKPCATTEGCISPSGGQSACVFYGAAVGAFCGGTCTADGDCPTGFDCLDATLVGGQVQQQCVAQSGECGCSEKSMELSLSTPCQTIGDFGSCDGQRVCGPTA